MPYTPSQLGPLASAPHQLSGAGAPAGAGTGTAAAEKSKQTKLLFPGVDVIDPRTHEVDAQKVIDRIYGGKVTTNERTGIGQLVSGSRK